MRDAAKQVAANQLRMALHEAARNPAHLGKNSELMKNAVQRMTPQQAAQELRRQRGAADTQMQRIESRTYTSDRERNRDVNTYRNMAILEKILERRANGENLKFYRFW